MDSLSLVREGPLNSFSNDWVEKKNGTTTTTLSSSLGLSKYSCVDNNDEGKEWNKKELVGATSIGSGQAEETDDEDENEEEEGSWENSSNPSATTTDESCSSNSSNSTTAHYLESLLLTESREQEEEEMEKKEMKEVPVEKEKKKILSKDLMATALAPPFTPSYILKSPEVSLSTSNSLLDSISTTSSLISRNDLPLQTTPFLIEKKEEECEWKLDNETGVLTGSNNLTYDIADEILQLQQHQVTLPLMKKIFSPVGIRNFDQSSLSSLWNSNSHSRHSSLSSSTTTTTNTSSTTTSTSNSYNTSTTTPDRSPSSHQILSGTANVNHSFDLNSSTVYPSRPRSALPPQPSPTHNRFPSTCSSSSSSSQFDNQTSFNSLLLGNSTYSSLEEETHLYHLARQTFIDSSLPSPPSTANSISSTNHQEDLIQLMSNHFDHSMSTPHPLATLFDLSLEQGDELVREPFKNGINEFIWRVGVSRMKFGLVQHNNESGGDYQRGDGMDGNRKYGLYKTELCRSWEESGMCRYGGRCQFAHGIMELREIARHPKFKSEICRTFWVHGNCPYGRRCCFLHTSGGNQPFGTGNSSTRNSFNLSPITSNYNYSQQQQQQYSSLSNTLSDYFEPPHHHSSPTSHLQVGSHQQQHQRNPLGSLNQSQTYPPMNNNNQRPQPQSSYTPLTPPTSRSQQPQQPPQRFQTSPLPYNFSPSSTSTSTSTSCSSSSSYFSSSTSNEGSSSSSSSIIPCARNGRLRSESNTSNSSSSEHSSSNSSSLGSILESSTVHDEGEFNQRGRGKKLNPIGAEIMKKVTATSTTTSFEEKEKEASRKIQEGLQNLSFSLAFIDRSLDSTPLAKSSL